MNRTIKNVAVLGSGIMGSRIACHFANIGVHVLLLDMLPKDADPAVKGKDTKAYRNSITDKALHTAISSNPQPLYKKSLASKITTGNFTDNLKEIAVCDWIIEVVVENLEIKKKLFDEVEKFRKPGTIVTSNTSGIPIHLMLEGRGSDFKKYFCGTHFFNPPRYLRLLEIIPTPETDPDITDFLMHYGDLYLGKTTVLCKDTPAFIANRIGVFAIMSLLHEVEKSELTVEQIDKLTGPVLGRPKSATFRTTDIVGLDTMVHVANGLYAHCLDDSAREQFKLPGFVSTMVTNKWLGDKTGQGFYKKVKGENGKSEILALDLKTLEYRPQVKVKFATLESTKGIDDLATRMKMLYTGTDKAGAFYKAAFNGLFKYVSERVPEIADEIFRIDAAMQAGFGWELGPFETWDAVGLKESIPLMEAAGLKPAPWVYEMLSKGFDKFYKTEKGTRYFYDVASGNYTPIPGTSSLIILNNLRVRP